MSRVLPILFNTDMVRAILDGRKTVTRRLIKLPDGMSGRPIGDCRDPDNPLGFMNPCGIKRPPYDVGDILYVRETWNTYCEGCLSKNLESVLGSTCAHACGENGNGYYYKATDKNHVRWHPSIHMPKEAARIWLKVKDVRVERLQEITEEQAKREGIQYDECPTGFTWKEETDIHNCYTTPIGAMQALWNSTIKKSDLDRYGWEANPWVWVIEFERCEKPGSE